MRRPTTIDPGFDSLPAIHDAQDDSKPISPERALWLAVIARAWLDAFEASDYFLRASQTAEERRDFDPEISRGDARRWLTLDFNPWREDRETVCDLAEISESMLRNAAKAKLAQVKQAAAENRTAQVIALDTAFAALLDDSDRMAAADLNAALEALANLELTAA